MDLDLSSMDIDFFNLNPEAQMDHLMSNLSSVDIDFLNLTVPEAQMDHLMPNMVMIQQQPPLPSLPYPATDMREMLYHFAAMQPITIDEDDINPPPKRRNVRTSTDPQSVAARQRRERISERIRILQHLVPGGRKMDTASMLEEAIHYVQFLKAQVQSLQLVAEAAANNFNANIDGGGLGLISDLGDYNACSGFEMSYNYTANY